MAKRGECIRVDTLASKGIGEEIKQKLKDFKNG